MAKKLKGKGKGKGRAVADSDHIGGGSSARYSGSNYESLNSQLGEIIALPEVSDVEGPLGRKTQCCVWSGFKKAITAQPEFPKPVKTPAEPIYRLDHINNTTGIGVFARRSIGAGQLILSERPLLIVQPRGKWNVPTDKPGPELERILEGAIDQMDPEDQEAFRSLANTHLHDGTPPLMGTLRTNDLKVEGLLELMPDIPNDQEHHLYAVCETMSRLNHSCSPNTSHYFDPASFAFRLHAVRDIPAGTEITITYCETLLPAADRQRILQQYDIVCTCNACKNAVESDERRARIAALPEPDYTLNGWMDNPSLPDDYIIRQVSENLALLEEEGLEALDDYRLQLVMIHKAYAALGDSENYEKLTIRTANAYLACGDFESMEIALLLIATATKPSAGNPNWEKRLKLKERQSSSDEN